MFKFRPDWLLIIPSLILTSLGLLILRSVAPQVLLQQFLFFIVAILLFILVSSLDFQLFFSLYLPMYVTSVILLGATFIFGTHSRGAARWLPLGFTSFQPSEIVKPFIFIFFSVLACLPIKKKALWLITSASIPLGLIFLQPDLGTMLVFLIGWLAIFFFQINLKTVLLLMLSALIMIIPVYKLILHDYQKDRLATFINPYKDPLNKGYHVIQSIISVGSGEFLGRGLGQGTQSQLRFLPEHHTDFIFAALSEELGFVGSALIITFFLILLWRIYVISQLATSAPASIFCLSVCVFLAFQTFVNIGMNMGVAPVTGITLPFLSSGGSSLVSLGLTLGLVNSISVHSRQASTFQIH